MLRRTVLLLPCIIALLIYLPSLRSDFVYDARAQILTDDYIHQPAHLKDVLTFRVLGQDVLDNDRPVHLAVYLIESLVWGRNPFGYHLTSILLHAANVLLLTLLLARWLNGARPLNAGVVCAACAALLYAVHPINVEAVAEPSYREDLLATFFTLAGLLLGTQAKPSIALIPFCFFLGIASKENAIVGPPALMLYWLTCRRGESTRRWLSVTGASLAVVIGFLFAYRICRPATSHIFLYAPPKIADTFPGIAAKQVRVFTVYFLNLIHPTHLSADYPLSTIDPISQAAAWITVAVFLIAQLLLITRSRLHLMAAAIFWLGLATVSNFVPIYRPIADRFLYLPLIGLAVHLAILLAPLAKRFPRSAAAATLLLAVPLAILTIQRQRLFHDSISLWTDTLQHNPDSFTAYDNLAFGCFDAGEDSAAVRNWQQALKHATSPAIAAEAFAGLAIGLDALDHHSEADAAYQRAVSLVPRYADPKGLVTDMSWERPHAAALQKIADRNRAPALLSF